MLSILAVLAVSLILEANAQNNLVTPSVSGTLSALRYTNVGGSGTYNRVTNMIPGTWPSCTANPSCIQSPVSVGGPLSPFDEDITIVFSGPMTLFNIAVYQPPSPSAGTWQLVSSWAQNQPPNNLVFMNNLGGGASGEWTICGGNSQSYASGFWNSTVPSPNAQLYSGTLPGGHEINILTATECNSGNCPGFFHGAANLGWAGSKMFVIDYNMPSDPTYQPSIWALNGQIVRAAQYGCNCRGVGSPGGCGELDIAETLSINSPQAISEIYTFKGATGTGSNNWFPRPTSGRATIAVILDVQTDAISILRFTNWDYTQNSLPRSVIDGYLNSPALVVPFGTDNTVQSGGSGGGSSGGSGGGSGGGSTAPASGGVHQLHPNGNSGKCIDVQGGVVANGTPVQIYDCNGTGAQNWVLSRGTTSIQLANTNFCLDVGTSSADGVKMKIMQCASGSASQMWTYASDNRLIMQNQNFCLDLTNGSTGDGHVVQIWTCTSNNSNQVWTE